MTDAQTLEIHNYLQGKKLPLDILIEVQDHFISQILAFQKTEAMGFEQAFLKTKLQWKIELSFRKKSIFSFQKVTRFLYEMHEQQYKKLSRTALYFALLFSLLQLCSVFLFEKEIYYVVNVFLYTSAILIGIAVLIYFLFIKINKKRTMVEQYFYTDLTSLFIVVCCLGIFNFFGELSTNQFKVIYVFLQQTGEIAFEEFLSAVSMMFVNVAVLSYNVLLLKTRAKAIKKVRNLVYH